MGYFIPGIDEGEIYKYEVKTQEDYILVKSDPLAFWSEVRPKTASVVYDLNHYHWEDQNWMNYREEYNAFDKPMSIYEVHLGSWRRKGENGSEFLTYREMADRLVPYVVNMGFTHVEFCRWQNTRLTAPGDIRLSVCSRRPAVSARRMISAI